MEETEKDLHSAPPALTRKVRLTARAFYSRRREAGELTVACKVRGLVAALTTPQARFFNQALAGETAKPW
jgi:hypothetical protein